jgi:hypothetical protein
MVADLVDFSREIFDICTNTRIIYVFWSCFQNNSVKETIIHGRKERPDI